MIGKLDLRIISTVLASCTAMFKPLFLLLTLVSSSDIILQRERRRCEPVAIPMCKNVSHNLTSSPNLVGDATQEAAAMRIGGFQLLLQANCSPYTKTFLCLMFAPVCTERPDVTLVVPPCRSWCLDVQSSCENILRTFQLAWPEMLSCEGLPDSTDDLCFSPPRTLDAAGSRITTDDDDGRDDSRTFAPEYFDISLAYERELCPDRFVFVDRLHVENANRSCAPRCDVDVMYRREDKDVMLVWMLVWSLPCFIASSFTVFTYLVDKDRFKYPFRPVVFMSLCYAIYSIACMLPAMLGPKAVACEQSAEGREFLVQKSLKQPWCFVVFFVLYYFGMAGSSWWVMLAVAWFLTAGCRWSSEAVEAQSSLFHRVAWTVPALQTAVVLVKRSVDGDELTGLCYVGPWESAVYTILVVVPLICHLVVSVSLIFVGFLCLPPVLTRLKQDGRECSGLQKVMSKMAAHTAIYVVSTLYLIICHAHVVSSFHHWVSVAMATPCPSQEDCRLDRHVSNVNVFFISTFMTVALGMGSAVWVCSYKTFQSWRLAFTRCFSGKTKDGYVV